MTPKVPVELTTYNQWVVWKYATTEQGKFTKLPYCSRTGQLASVADPSTWSDYQSSVVAMQSGHYSGLGFVLSQSDPFCFIDLDDPDGNPEITDKQIKIADSFNSYSERSPSGKGLHIICRANIPGGRRKNKIEIYSSFRYMTITGMTFKDAPIADCQQYADMLWHELSDGKSSVDELQITERVQTMSDEQLYDMASNAENGNKFQELWQGTWETYYQSQSEADFALINILGFYSRNVQQINRMFLISGLGKREKAKRKNYVEAMIKRSFDNQPPLLPLDQILQSQANRLAKLDALKDAEAAVVDVKPASFSGPLFEGKDDPAFDWTVPPGLLGEITQFIYNAAPRPVKEIALGGAIGMMAGICGRAYNVSGTGLNQYVLILAKTGVGKEAAAGGINKLMHRVKGMVPSAMDFIGPAEIASGQALIKYLDKKPCFVSILGEFGLALQQMCSPISSPSQVHLRKILLSLYNKSGATDIQSGMIYSDKDNNIGTLRSPSFSILGEATPETFYPNMDEGIIAEGLLPRFLCIEYRGDRPSYNENHLTVQPNDELLKRLAELTAQCLMLSHHQRCINIDLDAEAKILSNKFDKLCDARINTSEMEVARQLWNRAHIKALKLAGLIAIGMNPYNSIITYEALNWAIALVERDIKNILTQFETGRAGKDFSETNQLNELCMCIGDYIKRPYTGLEKYQVPTLMHQDKVVPLAYLQRRLMQKSAFINDRIGSTAAIHRAIKGLQDEGTIRELRQHDIYTRYAKTAKCYIVLDLTRFSK